MNNKNFFKISLVIAAVAVLIGGLLWYVFTVVDKKNLQANTNEALDFVIQRETYFEDHRDNDKVKSLMFLVDKTTVLKTIMEVTPNPTSELLDKFVQNQRITGALVLDGNLHEELQSSVDGDSMPLWSNMANTPYVAQMANHQREVYTTRLVNNGKLYNFAAMSRIDKPGVVITYDEVRGHSETRGDITLNMLLMDLPLEMQGVIVISDGNKIIWSNDANLQDQLAKQVTWIRNCRSSEDYEIVQVKDDSGTWFIGKKTMKNITAYVKYPASQVFMNRNIICGTYGAIVVVLFMLMLVVRSRMANNALKQNQKRMSIINALGTAYSSIFLADLRHLDKVEVIKYIAAPRQKYHYRDFTKAELKKEISRSVDPEFCDEYFDFLDMTTVEERLKGRDSIIFTIKSKSGKWIHNMIVPQYYDSKGRLVAVLVATRDVTQERQLEEKQKKALEIALAMAEHANQAKTVFLNNMSHDIRTPMNAIIGFTSLATANVDDKSRVVDYLRKIHISSKHLLSLINDILDMSRIESGKVKLEEADVHLPDILKDIRSIVYINVKAKQQELYMDTQNIIHEDIVTDRLRLTQVLLNIISNSVKFTPEGGEIHICVTERPSAKDGYAAYEFRIKDNGIGMSEEFQRHIFDSFTRERTSTESGIQGTGLGMAIAKNIVDMMGGNITLHSEKNKGTEFFVNIEFKISSNVVNNGPVSELQGVMDQDTLETPTTEFQRQYDGHRVLLAEDNELNREIITAILEELGLEVDSVNDGIEAVDMVKSKPEDYYDLIFMDIQMPKMDGYQATREIRGLSNRKKAEIPIVAMTANAFEEDRKKAFDMGMNGHIAKPIDVKVIIKTLDRIFDVDSH